MRNLGGGGRTLNTHCQLGKLCNTPHVLRYAPLTCLLPGLATLCICLFQLTSRQLWRDEHSTWWAATLPLGGLWRLLSNVDIVLLPYYLFMRVWVLLFGDSALSLRLPSALAMAAAATGIAWLGRRLDMPRAGLAGGMLFAVVPSVARYGQEARPYAFTIAVCIASTLLLLRALEAPRSRKRWLQYASSLVLLGGLHLVAITVLIAHATLLLEPTEGEARVRLQREALVGFILAALLALCVLAPMAFLASRQADQISWTLGVAARLRELPRMLFTAPRVGQIVIVGGLLAIWKELDRQRLFLAAWALGPSLLLYFTHSHLHLFIYRYLLFTLPAWVLLCGCSADDVSRGLESLRVPRVLAWIVPLALAGWVAREGWDWQCELRARVSPGRRQYDYLGVADYITKHQRPGDGLAFAGPTSTPNWTRMALLYEWRAKPAPADLFMARSPAETGWFTAEECPEPARCLPETTKRIWLVTTTDEDDLLANMPGARRELLANEFEIADVEGYRNIKAVLFKRR